MNKTCTPKWMSQSINGLIILTLTSVIGLSSCKKDEAEPIINDPLDAMIGMLDLQPLPAVEHPLDNASNDAKIELGRLLFWDPIVGGEKDMACATCHHPDLGYGDGLDLPIGVNGSGLGPDRTENTGGINLASAIERVPRNAPTIINSAFNGLIDHNGYDPSLSPMFWDSRGDALEGQCQGPPASRSEMRGEAYDSAFALTTIVTRIAAIPEYVSLFEAVFGAGGVTVENFTFAISAFERAIVADNSPYDQYIKGDLTALTKDQKNGLILFHGKAGCTNCHMGPMMSDYDLHVMGGKDNPLHPEGTDTGLDDEYKFRTPSLRNATLTGPYTHSGMIDNLRDMVVYMSSGKSGNPNVTSSMLETDFIDQGLTDAEIDQIVAFIESLTDENFDKEIPTSVPSGLEVGGNIH